jgi:hypothetical protein
MEILSRAQRPRATAKIQVEAGSGVNREIGDWGEHDRIEPAADWGIIRPAGQWRLCFSPTEFSRRSTALKTHNRFINREQVNAHMTITYRLEPRDLRVFHAHFQKHSPAGRRMRLIAFLFLAAGVLFRAAMIEDTGMTIRVVTFAIEFPVFCIIYLCLIRLTRQIVLWRSLTTEKQRSVLCEHTITLTDDALLEVTPFNESKQFWKGIYQVVDTPGYIYIFTTQHSAQVVPKRAFADAEGAYRFYQYADALHTAAMSKVN